MKTIYRYDKADFISLTFVLNELFKRGFTYIKESDTEKMEINKMSSFDSSVPYYLWENIYIDKEARKIKRSLNSRKIIEVVTVKDIVSGDFDRPTSIKLELKKNRVAQVSKDLCEFDNDVGSITKESLLKIIAAMESLNY